jgi:hypothetical protein
MASEARGDVNLDDGRDWPSHGWLVIGHSLPCQIKSFNGHHTGIIILLNF